MQYGQLNLAFEVRLIMILLYEPYMVKEEPLLSLPFIEVYF
tara:strand:+ start:131 stop:253 length:123 start_codon:yes stop_codon:yes gene_type:complete